MSQRAAQVMVPPGWQQLKLALDLQTEALDVADEQFLVLALQEGEGEGR